MSGHDDSQGLLRGFKRTQDFLVGIDSDGCAFDTMEVKHKECFIPAFVMHFKLAAVSKFARECCEFVNLYSKDRGINRFPAYLKALDLLAERSEVQRRAFSVPALTGLRSWISRESKLANSTLRTEVEKTRDPDLASIYAWSVDVNRRIEETVKNVPPFPLVRESLERLRNVADVLVVSATPGEALKREWEEHRLAPLVALIAGQELGTKNEQLALAAAPERYARDRVLMVGDAPSDRRAAEANGVLFYPINPGHEDESWQRFHDEVLSRFFAGTYAGDYMKQRVTEFEALLPDAPPWKKW
jgi:phosphoglycolate phosphatase-like HAD superfamily hydrolase